MDLEKWDNTIFRITFLVGIKATSSCFFKNSEHLTWCKEFDDQSLWGSFSKSLVRQAFLRHLLGVVLGAGKESFPFRERRVCVFLRVVSHFSKTFSPEPYSLYFDSFRNSFGIVSLNEILCGTISHEFRIASIGSSGVYQFLNTEFGQKEMQNFKFSLDSSSFAVCSYFVNSMKFHKFGLDFICRFILSCHPSIWLLVRSYQDRKRFISVVVSSM